jgi:hypothetical protein
VTYYKAYTFLKLAATEVEGPDQPYRLTRVLADLACRAADMLSES